MRAQVRDSFPLSENGCAQMAHSTSILYIFYPPDKVILTPPSSIEYPTRSAGNYREKVCSGVAASSAHTRLRSFERRRNHDPWLSAVQPRRLDPMHGWPGTGLPAGVGTDGLQKPELFSALVSARAKINSDKRAEKKLKFDFEKYQDHVAEQKRKIELELSQSKGGGGLTPEALAKIEEALNLL